MYVLLCDACHESEECVLALFYKKITVYLWRRFTIERSVFLFSLVYERALRGCLNNRNSVHFQPEVHGFFLH